MGSNRENSLIAIAILHFGREPKIISYFGGTNNIFVDYTY